MKRLLIILALVLAPLATAVPPQLDAVQDQTIQCDETFAPIDLNALTTDPDTPPAQLRYNAYDYFDMDVDIDNGVATIYNPGYDRTEFIGFRVVDENGDTDTVRAQFTVQGCPDPSRPDGNATPIPPPHNEINYIEHNFFNTNIFGLNQRPPRETCAISTGSGLLDDLDCDGIPDRDDNCPDRPNPSQRDQNKNGLGDACDLIIADLTIQPQQLTCGRSVLAKARIVNNLPEPQRDIKATLASRSIDIRHTDYVKLMEPGSAATIELTARIPYTAEPGRHSLDAIIDYQTGPQPQRTGATRDITVTDATCGQPQEENKTLTVTEIEDVRPGEQAVWPVEVTNPEDTAEAFQFTVKGANDFGHWTLSPGSVVIIGPGETETVYVTVEAFDDIRTGSRTFTLEAKHGDDAAQVSLVATILDEQDTPNFAWLYTGLFGGLLLLVLAIAALYRNETTPELVQ